MQQALRIAVADDEADMRDYFRRMLARMGHSVVAVGCNGRELVEHCRLTHPDLVITDVRMPEMDGLEAAMLLWEEGDLPVILVSAHHEPEPPAPTSNYHVLAYLVKPIKRSDLEAAIALARPAGA